MSQESDSVILLANYEEYVLEWSISHQVELNTSIYQQLIRALETESCRRNLCWSRTFY